MFKILALLTCLICLGSCSSSQFNYTRIVAFVLDDIANKGVSKFKFQKHNWGKTNWKIGLLDAVFEDGFVVSPIDVESVQKEISSIKLFAIDNTKLKEKRIKQVIKEFEAPNLLDGIVVINKVYNCISPNVCLEVGVYWNRNERVIDYLIKKDDRDWIILERNLRN